MTMDSLHPHILLIEDDMELAEWIEDYLSSKGFRVSHSPSGKLGIEIALTQSPELVLLDGMLPDIDGLDICKQIRSDYKGAIVMLTARDEEIDEVLGLEMGADDYVIKPVRARALLARIRSHLQKQSQQPTEPVVADNIVLGHLVINAASRTVSLRQTGIEFTSHEFDLLWLLAVQAGKIVSRDELVSQLRGFEYDGYDRSIDLRISRLRKKLGDSKQSPELIKTVRGKGYLLAKNGWL